MKEKPVVGIATDGAHSAKERDIDRLDETTRKITITRPGA